MCVMCGCVGVCIAVCWCSYKLVIGMDVSVGYVWMCRCMCRCGCVDVVID